MKLRNALATAALTVALVLPTAIVATASPNPDPQLAGISSELRSLADQIDAYSVTTTTTTVPVTTTSQPPTTTAPAPSRNLALSPCGLDSVWNTRRGSGAVFDSRSVISTGGINVNTVAYGVSINGAGYTSPLQVGFEQHNIQIQPDGVTAWVTTAFLPAGTHVVVDLNGSCLNQTVAGNPSAYERATKMSGVGGPLRAWELQAAVNGDVHAIKHAIGLGVASTVLAKSFTWPAFAQDSFAGTNTGFMPEGGFMAIPNAAPPAGLNNVQTAVWWALHDYGAYAVDATGQGGTLTVVEGEAAAASITNAQLPNNGAGLSAIMNQLRWVTNASQANVGGPGARL